MESIIGQMEAIIKAILSKECGTGMEFGKMRNRYIKVIIGWIKNRVSVYINGFLNKSIRESLEMIIVLVMGSFIVSGKMKRKR
jgi:hypothetical protein